MQSDTMRVSVIFITMSGPDQQEEKGMTMMDDKEWVRQQIDRELRLAPKRRSTVMALAIAVALGSQALIIYLLLK